MNRVAGTWQSPQNLDPQRFSCGHCGHLVASDRGYFITGATRADGRTPGAIYICPNCNRPSYFEGDLQIPGVPSGNPVGNVPPDVGSLYDETRGSTAAAANTLAVLGSRKLLMHIAVDKGAPTGKSFLEYVEYLADKGFVPPDGKAWVDHIRTKGNEANHEIRLMSPADAQELIRFAEMLLRFIYEFPALVPSKKPSP